MKRKNLELLVLILGIAIIVVALFFMLGQEKTANTIFITNLVFSVGFLIYILYSMMTTNSLNGEIRRLGQQIRSLKDELKIRENTIAEKDTRIAHLNRDKQNLEEQNQSIQKQLLQEQEQGRELQSRIATLQAELNQREGE